VRRVLVCLLASAAALSAQQPLRLTLDEAHRLAIANNPRLNVAQLNAAAAAQIPLQLHAAAEPMLAGAITAVGADSGSRLAAGGLNNPAVYNRLASGVSISQLITDFGRTRNLVDSARYRAQAQDQVATATRAQILLAVDQAYFAALRAEAVLKVAEQTVASRQTVADQTAALARSNLKSTLDVSFANVNLADAKLLLAASRSNVQASYADLGAALGLPAQFGQGGFSLMPEPLPAALAQPLDELVRQAMRDRPELAGLRLEQSAAERFSRAEKDLSLPTIALAGTAGVAPVSDAQIQNRYGAVGVNVSIPILNGRLYHARQAEAELRARSASRNVDDIANRIARDVRVAWLNTGNAFERLALTAQLIEQARLALDLAQRRYDLGLTSIVELSQAQLNVTAAEIAASGAQFDYQLQRANLAYQTGALR
jgi:outer membrane protein